MHFFFIVQDIKDYIMRYKDYQFVLNERIIVFLDSEFQRLVKRIRYKSIRDKLRFVRSKIVYAIVEKDIKTIILYANIITDHKSDHEGDLITTIKVKDIETLDDVIRFCTTESNLDFQLSGSILNFKNSSMTHTRYRSTFFLSCDYDSCIQIEPDDVVLHLAIPGEPLNSVILLIMRFKNGRVTRQVFKIIDHRKAENMEASISSRCGIRGYLSDLFNSSVMKFIPKDNKPYNKLD